MRWLDKVGCSACDGSSAVTGLSKLVAGLGIAEGATTTVYSGQHSFCIDLYNMQVWADASFINAQSLVRILPVYFQTLRKVLRVHGHNRNRVSIQPEAHLQRMGPDTQMFCGPFNRARRIQE